MTARRRTSLGPSISFATLLLVVGGLLAAGLSLGPGEAGNSPRGPVPELSVPAGPTAATGTPLTPGPFASMVLSVAGSSPAAISLSWTDPGSFLFSSYTVYESTNGSTGPWSSVGTLSSASSTQLAVDRLTPGENYSWEVVEAYGFGNSLTSNVVAWVQPPVAVLAATGVTPTGATLQWTNNASYGGLLAFSSYELWETPQGGTPGLLPTYGNVSERSASVTGLSPGSGYSFYVVTNDCTAGCTTGTPTLSPTQSNSIPVGTQFPLTVTVTALHSVVDVGQLAYFTCTPSGGAAPYSFAWDFGNGTYESLPASTSVRFASAGPATVTCRVSDANNSTALQAIGLTVNPAPVTSVVLNRTAADVGQAVSFTCTVSGGTSPTFIGWSFGDGSSATGANATHAYPAAGTMVAACSGSDGAGASLFAAATVVVSGLPLAGASVSSSAAAPGTSVTFVGTTSNGSGDWPVLHWAFSNGASGTGRNVTEAFATAGTVTATFSATDSNGATASARVTLSVSPLTAALSSDPSSGTEHQALSFEATASGGAGGPYNFTWQFGDGSVGYGASVTHTYGASGHYAPTLTVTDALGARNVTTLAPLSVSAPPPLLSGVFPLGLLAVAVLVAAIGAFVAYRRRRARESETHQRVAGWVPPTPPSETVSGMKTCSYCRASNLPVRRTCSACGKPLPRAPTP